VVIPTHRWPVWFDSPISDQYGQTTHCQLVWLEPVGVNRESEGAPGDPHPCLRQNSQGVQLTLDLFPMAAYACLYSLTGPDM